MIHLCLQDGVPAGGAAARWLYVGDDTTWRVTAERGPLAGIPRVPTGALVETASRELRNAYRDWVGELSRVNASREWWACELAAKNPFARLYPRVCALAAGTSALAGDPSDALVVCATPALLAEMAGVCESLGVESNAPAAARRPDWRTPARRVIETVARRAPIPARALPLPARRAVEESAGYRARIARSFPRAEPLAGERSALFFTWVDERSAAVDGYRDPHFGDLPRLMREAGWETGFVPMVLPTAGSYARVMQALAGTGERFWPPAQWLQPQDTAAATRAASAFAPAIPAGARVAGVPIARLASEHVAETRRAHAANLGLAALPARLADAGVRPSRVFLPFEGHAWEQAVTDGARRAWPGARVVGCDNVNFSRLALSLYPAEQEHDARPLPDVVVTCGATFEQILLDEGWPRARVRRGCAIRHAYLDGVEPGAPSRGGPRRVLVAGVIDAGQTFELVDKARTAFAGDAATELVVRFHPASDRELLRRLLPDVAGADAPISELLGTADALLYGYSVVCYEALAAGVPPVFVRSDTFLDLDQLEPFPDLRRAARSPEEIRAQVDEAIAQRDEAWLERAAVAVREALHPVERECVNAYVAG